MKMLTMIFLILLGYHFSDEEDIHNAAKEGDITKVMSILNEHPERVNEINLYGYAPLHLASLKGHQQMVELLLKYGADINIKTKSGCTALYYAQTSGHTEIAKLLISKGADQSPRVWPAIAGEYLGETKPDSFPKIFAPGIISSMYWEHGPLVFTADGTELFWSVVLDEPNGFILYTKMVDNEWSEPKVLPFSQMEFRDICPSLSYDENRLFFTSMRPSQNDSVVGNYNIWYSDRKQDGWSNANLIAPDISSGKDARPTFSKSGTMYFGSWRDGSIDGTNIFFSEYKNGKYSTPQRLNSAFNTSNAMPTYIAPDESYLIFESFKQGGFGGSDFWITFKNSSGIWEDAINLGDNINSKFDEWFGGFSSDLKYFFFVSNRTGNNDIYWIDARFINQLHHNH